MDLGLLEKALEMKRFNEVIEENKKLKTLLFNINIDKLNYTITDSTFLGEYFKFRTASVY